MLARRSRMSRPRVVDMKAARRAPQVRGRARLGLLVKYGENSSSPTLSACADAGRADDQEQRKSTTGYSVLQRWTQRLAERDLAQQL